MSTTTDPRINPPNIEETWADSQDSLPMVNAQEFRRRPAPPRPKPAPPAPEQPLYLDEAGALVDEAGSSVPPKPVPCPRCGGDGPKGLQPWALRLHICSACVRQGMVDGHQRRRLRKAEEMRQRIQGGRIVEKPKPAPRDAMGPVLELLMRMTLGDLLRLPTRVQAAISELISACGEQQ